MHWVTMLQVTWIFAEAVIKDIQVDNLLLLTKKYLGDSLQAQMLSQLTKVWTMQ